MKPGKILILIILLVSGIDNIYSQEWMQSVTNPNPSFFEIQNAFNDYWKNRTIEKGQGYKPFKRWEWFWQQRVSNDGQFPRTDINWIEWENYLSTHPEVEDESNNRAANWVFKGPATSPGGYSGIGRINCIGFHPTLPNTFWAGSPAGGLWKTTNAGTTWTTNTDNLPVMGVSDIAIDPTNANIMYIATGDGDAALSLNNGSGDTKSVGVLKSINGGSTWTTTGLNWNVTSQKLIRRLIINPNNPQILLAAASDGIYRTTNGGTTWTGVAGGWHYIDLEFKPGDPNYVYASSYNTGGNAQIFRSSDGGSTWFQMTSFSGYIRINLAVSANYPLLVDALCADSQGGLGGLWYSNNSGGSFTQYFFGNCSNNLLNNSFDASSCGGQGFYDLSYAINPSDYNEIWMGGVNTWRTTDGGGLWYLNNIWSSSQTTAVQEVHADKHFIAFHPLNNSYLFECNDGGLYLTSNGGTNWLDITNGMGISQIYRIGTSATVNNKVLCGLQDNGSKQLQGGVWSEQTGGDGMETIIDYSNANIEYATYTNGQISKTTDGGTNWSVIVQNNGTSGTVNEPGNWVTPYVIHPTDHNILLVGKSQVYKTTDGGSSWNQLGTISGLTTNINSIAFSQSNPNYIYVASQNQVFKTTDGGSSWIAIGVSASNITYLAVSSSNPQRIYVTYTQYNAGDKVDLSTNAGSTWTNYSGTLPNVPVNCIVYQNGSNDGVYIGTDLGVFYRNNTMSDWITYDAGLPNVIVNELEISYNNNKLWAATFGRGLWNSDLYTPPAPVASFNANTTSFCVGGCVNFTSTSTNSPTAWNWSFPGGSPSSSSSENPTGICYNIPGNYNVSLTVFNLGGNDIQTNTSYIHVLDCSGTSEQENSSLISIYPNPNNGQFMINSEITEPVYAQMVDLLGKPVSQNILIVNGTNLVNVSHLPKGIYLIKIPYKDKEFISRIVID